MASERLDQILVSGDVPRHVAVIMDGNGRWAQQRGLPRHLGHREGMKSVREAIEGAVEAGVEILTLFAFSTENWNRPVQEVSALMGLLQLYARRERAELKRRGVDVKEGFETEIMKSIKISQVYSEDGETILTSACLQDVRIKLQNSPLGEIFVTRDNGELYGTITLADLSDSAFDHGFDDLVTASDVARLHPPILVLSDNLETALAVMRDSGEEHIAVVDDILSIVFKGCVHHREV
ncbi:MAG: di-trans,poly-cis-decaprenylcistransferase, partial [Gemmatimonadales bacterium]|nr:di-trans,poly-cis-decaprenylcistransferase [Gemmatimonadales bacterium]